MASTGKSTLGRIFDYLSTILREHAESLILVLSLALLVRWLVLSAFVLRSDAMAPTLLEGEVVIGYRPPFGLELPVVGELAKGREAKAGELIISNCPTGLCLQRVVAVSGDRVEMLRQRLSINGQICKYQEIKDLAGQLEEACPGFTATIRIDANWANESWGPTMVPPGQVFVLNDNRVQPGDSRLWGPLKAEDIHAKVTAIWLSLNWGASKGESWLRPNRSFSRLN